MLSRNFFIISIFFTSFSCFAKTPICASEGAYIICSEGSLPFLNVSGKADLRQVHVGGDGHVAGMLSASDSTFQDLTVAGKASLDHAVISGVVHISGMVKATQCVFKGPVHLSTDASYFSNTKLQSVEVNAGNDFPVIYLSENTIILGDIVFSSRNGKVYVDSSVKINGKLIGGQLILNKHMSYIKGG